MYAIFNIYNLLIMKFKLFFLIFYIALLNSTQSQTISPVAQNVGGNIGFGTGYSLSYSMGELSSISNFSSSNNLALNTGFFQSFIPLVTGINEIYTIPSEMVIITPNPVLNNFKLKTFFQKTGEMQFQIIDIQSNQKYTSMAIKTFGNYEQLINVENYSSGLYYLKLLFKPSTGKPLGGVYKILKL